MKRITGILVSIILTGSCFAQEPVAIVEKSRETVKVSSFEALSRLVITDSKGNQRLRNNTMASKTTSDGTEKRIIKFTAPAEIKGTGILIFDYESKNDDMWIYLPAMRKTRRIVSSEKSKSFMGSEFSNADMTAPTLSDFNYELLGSETFNGTECWKIAAIPANIDLEEEYGYSRSISFIGINDYIVRKTAYYDYDNELFKTILTIDFELLDVENNKYMITAMTASNHQNGRRSELTMDQVTIADTDDNYFSVSFLER
ncbi:outer membrane lipoprotein-sorting protein [Bacteroidota bacterium]